MLRFLQAASLVVLPIGAGLSDGWTQNQPPDQATYYVANTRPPDAFLALRTHPTTARGLRIATMPNGTAVRVIERRPDGWWYVRVVATGQEGWALAHRGDRTWIECCITASVSPPAPAPDSEPVGFRSPSSNIHCQLFEGVGDQGAPATKALRCDVMRITNRLPARPKDCELEWGQAFEIGDGAQPGQRLCYGDTVADEKLLTLSYGQVWERSGFKCKSEPAGVTCINASGHGFELSRGAQRVF